MCVFIFIVLQLNLKIRLFTWKNCILWFYILKKYIPYNGIVMDSSNWRSLIFKTNENLEKPLFIIVNEFPRFDHCKNLFL